MNRFKGNYLVAVLLALSVHPLQGDAARQEVLPAPPADPALVYYFSNNQLAALPFEPGQSSFKSNAPPKQTRTGFIELKGEHAATNLREDVPRLFLFTSKQPGSHPPFLVMLTVRHGARRVTAVAQQGLKGFAIDSNEIIKPNVRVIAPAGEQVFMEIRPRISLMPGEYAIIGDDLARIATFRVVAAKQ
jgi:hypothetical protein